MQSRIDVLWRTHFIDSQVRAAVMGLFSGEANDMLLVNDLARHTKNPTADEVRASIARCGPDGYPVLLGVHPLSARNHRR